MKTDMECKECEALRETVRLNLDSLMKQEKIIEGLESKWVEIWYFVDNAKHALRHRIVVPRVGDFVKLKTGNYEVFRVLWVDDNPDNLNYFHVRVDIRLVRESE